MPDKPCPSCRSRGRDRSGNHLFLLEDGVTWYCNRCHYIEKGEQLYSEPEQKNYVDISTISELLSGEIPDRKIRSSTSENYGVKLEYDPSTRDIVKHFYPITKDKVITGYKVRALPKVFASVGDSKGKVDLFGQAVTPAGGKKLLITGGELDALAAFQMLYDKYPNFKPSVVSLPKGENVTSVKDNLSYVQSFSEVLIHTDMDEVGRSTADAIAKLVGPKAKHSIRVKFLFTP